MADAGGYMTRETYRQHHSAEIEQYKRQGIEVDVCHIVAEHNGGADDPRNYILAPSHFNRSIGARWDPLMYAVAYGREGIEKVRAARESSGHQCSREEAKDLVHEGIEQFKKYHLLHTTAQGEQIVQENTTITSLYLQYLHYTSTQTGGKYKYSEELNPELIQIWDPVYCQWVTEVWDYGLAEQLDRRI